MKIEQKNIPWLGKVIDSFVTSLPLLSLINTVSVLTIMWNTTISPFAKLYFPWFTAPYYFTVVVVGLSVAMFIVYKYVLPSVWAYRGTLMKGNDDNSDKN